MQKLTLLHNIVKNDFPIDRRLRCYIAPNRLLANPIIYERHQGNTLEKWKTGNQYAFVAEMYYEDGLNIEDICDVLNESRAKILKPLKAYNLFIEGQEILEKEDGIKIDISEFEITNLERFYNYEEAKKFLGIDFDNENGELLILLPREEFEKRLLFVFKVLLDSDRFSRDFNKDDEKKIFIENLKRNPEFNFDVMAETSKGESKSAAKKTDLEEEKSKITTRRKKRSKKRFYENVIIPRDKEIIFDNEKLDSLFNELKHLPIDKIYAFSVLLRTYLEQSLYFYIKQNALIDKLTLKANEENEKNGLKKVELLIKHLRGKYNFKEDIDSIPIMGILKFNSNKDFSNSSLKVMLDYVKNNELDDHLDTNQLKNLKFYIDNIKNGLDLAVHNIETIVDFSHNKRAWTHLEPLFDILSNNIDKDNK